MKDHCIGSLKFNKNISKEHYTYLYAFSKSPHVKLNEEQWKFLDVNSDYVVNNREEVGLPYGEDGQFVIFDTDHIENTFFEEDPVFGHELFENKYRFDFMVNTDRYSTPNNIPSIWCPFSVDWYDITELSAEGVADYRVNHYEWLCYMINNFFEPWGYKLSGEFIISDYDTGIPHQKIEVKDNEVKYFRIKLSYEEVTK